MNTSVARRDFLKKLAQVILKLDDLNEFLNSLTEMVVETFAVRWATLSLLDEASDRYILRASSQKKQDLEQDRQAAGVNNRDAWLRQRQEIISKRLLDEFGRQMDPELIDELSKTDTSVSLPLFAGRQFIGVLNLGPKTDNGLFAEEELEISSELAELTAAIIKQAIEHQKVAEQRLHHQDILDNLVSGIIAINPEGKVTVFNRAAERILKIKPEKVIGRHVEMLQVNLVNLLLDTLHKGKSYRREELYVLPENTLIGVSTSQFYDAQGRLLGACMVFSSLSEIKRKERQTRQQTLNTYWSNVANSLAHEVKNSIVAAKVFTEMFPQKYEDAEFRWSLYSALKRDMEKLDSFSGKLLDFVQAQDLVIQSCQMDKIIDGAINSALQDRDVGEITFEKRYSQNLKSLPGDYHQLKDAFAQIISNSLEAMGKKGRLSITVEQESGPEMLAYNLPEATRELPAQNIVAVKITDTGCGISAQDLPYVFDPFFTTKEAKAGLGLSTARKIIQRHGGIIKAESKPEEGATFWVCLPIRSKMEDRYAQSKSSHY